MPLRGTRRPFLRAAVVDENKRRIPRHTCSGPAVHFPVRHAGPVGLADDLGVVVDAAEVVVVVTDLDVLHAHLELGVRVVDRVRDPSGQVHDDVAVVADQAPVRTRGRLDGQLVQFDLQKLDQLVRLVGEKCQRADDNQGRGGRRHDGCHDAGSEQRQQHGTYMTPDGRATVRHQFEVIRSSDVAQGVGLIAEPEDLLADSNVDGIVPQGRADISPFIPDMFLGCATAEGAMSVVLAWRERALHPSMNPV